jgi:hypothetical protein
VEVQENQSNSGSLEVPKLDYTTTGLERNVAVLTKELAEIRVKMHEYETKKVIDESGLPLEILEQNGLLPSPPPKLKRGRGYRQILRTEIQEANDKSVNAAGAARYLNCNEKTYKKYAKMYGLYFPKPNVKGKRNLYDPERGKYPLSEILAGKHPNVSPFKIKDKLIRSGKKAPVCEQCGYSERRITDNKVPLLLNFLDDNPKNHVLENMKLYCFNCTFMCGRGYIRNGKQVFDPDHLQGAENDEIDEQSRY